MINLQRTQASSLMHDTQKSFDTAELHSKGAVMYKLSLIEMNSYGEKQNFNGV